MGTWGHGEVAAGLPHKARRGTLEVLLWHMDMQVSQVTGGGSGGGGAAPAPSVREASPMLHSLLGACVCAKREPAGTATKRGWPIGGAACR